MKLATPLIKLTRFVSRAHTFHCYTLESDLLLHSQATYSNSAGGVCASVSTSLPVVSINAADFGGGSACGQCVQVRDRLNSI